ncbi:MAG: LamG domain-containing protein [Planctomycetota bacterium]|jgi:hypothetical protein
MKDNHPHLTFLISMMFALFVFCTSFAFAEEFKEVTKGVPEPAKPGLVYMWLFDEGIAGHKLSTIYDTDNYWLSEYKTNFYQDIFKGNFEYVEGVNATAMKFDGFTARIIRTAVKVPDLSAAFTIEGWIAPRSTSRAVIVSQEKDYKEGFIFGLFDGQLTLQMSTGEQWIQCQSTERVPTLKWSHAAVTFDSSKGIDLYLNGKNVGNLPLEDRMQAARREDLIIGMSTKKDLSKIMEMEAQAAGFFISGFRLGQTPLSTEYNPVYTHMAFSGLMDELKLYNQALTKEDIQDLYKENRPSTKQPLQERIYSTGPKIENPSFGASYGRIPYYTEYEEVLRIGDFPDVLVRFDTSPVRLMFVHNNTYIPIWVTENNKMMSDQSVEINGINGWYEVMMDKQNRYSHVRVLENNDARIVVHWRYALCDRFYQIARPDEVTEWGDWVDEYFTIYPDAVAVRHWIYWTSTFGQMYLQFQETILKSQPGQSPEDILDVEALTLANMQGKTHTYSWQEGLPPYFPKPDGANIQLVNMKSKYKPFIVFEPGSRIDKYIWGRSRGRRSHLPGGPLTSGIPVISKGEKRDSYEAVALYGMTPERITQLLPLAKSWIQAPQLQVEGSGFENAGFNKFQRAYVLANGASKPSNLKIELRGTTESPIVNPAFVINNWGNQEIDLKINGKQMKPGSDFRFGHRNSVEGTDLVVWIKLQSTKSVQLLLSAQD